MLPPVREWEEGNQLIAKYLFPGLEKAREACVNSSTSSTVIPKGTNVPDMQKEAPHLRLQSGYSGWWKRSKGQNSSVHVLSRCHVITVTLIMATLYIYMLTVNHQIFLCMVQIGTF